MEFTRLLELVGNEAVFETSLLLAGDVDPAVVRLQLSRWKASGRIYQFRRGLYALAPPYQKISPHPFVIANHLMRASYVSCQSALAQYGLIPDVVPVTVSVTTSRPARWQTPLGDYEFHHIQHSLLLGYQMTDLGGGQQAFVATPEKAILDLIYLQPGGDSPAFLRELRLQNMEPVDLKALYRLAKRIGMPKLERAAVRVTELAQSEGEEYQTL